MTEPSEAGLDVESYLRAEIERLRAALTVAQGLAPPEPRRFPARALRYIQAHVGLRCGPFR